MQLSKNTVVNHAALKILRPAKWPDNLRMDVSVARHLPGIAALCEHYGVAHLELFGSATGPEFNPESSDLDFLVELDTQSPGSPARRWTGLADALEKVIGSPCRSGESALHPEPVLFASRQQQPNRHL